MKPKQGRDTRDCKRGKMKNVAERHKNTEERFEKTYKEREMKTSKEREKY